MAKLGKGFRVNADGKVEKTKRKLSVSERIRQKSSKRVKVAKRGQVQ